MKLNLFETHLAYYAYMTGDATKPPRLVGEPKPGESGEYETEVEVGMDTGPRRGRRRNGAWDNDHVRRLSRPLPVRADREPAIDILIFSRGVGGKRSVHMGA